MSSTPKEKLEVLKTHYTPTKLQTAVPLLFQGRTVDSAAAVDGVVEFLKTSLTNDFKTSLKEEVAKATPSAVTTTEINADLCKGNPFSSRDCFKISDNCFDNDYALKWLDYMQSRENVALTQECNTEVNRLNILHIDPPAAYRLPLNACEVTEQPVCVAENSPYNISTICQWQQDFFCYTHGAKVIASCSACTNQTVDCSLSVNDYNACCKPVAVGGCKQPDSGGSGPNCTETPDHPCCVDPTLEFCQ